MDRRQFISCFGGGVILAAGCRGTQKAHVMNPTEKDMVGSHTAGARKPGAADQQTVAQLLGPECHRADCRRTGRDSTRKKICFVGVENKAREEIGDFREQIYQKIDNCINTSESFEVIHRKFVEAGLRQCGLRPEDLFVPNNRRNFVAVMEQLQQPFDYLMYATITSGTTKSNHKDDQRDYLLTLS